MEIKNEESCKPYFKPLGRRFRNRRCVWLKKLKATPGSQFGCDKRCEQQMRSMTIALNRLKDIRRTTELAQCSVSEAVHLGDFPYIETMLS